MRLCLDFPQNAEELTGAYSEMLLRYIGFFEIRPPLLDSKQEKTPALPTILSCLRFFEEGPEVCLTLAVPLEKMTMVTFLCPLLDKVSFTIALSKIFPLSIKMGLRHPSSYTQSYVQTSFLRSTILLKTRHICSG